MSQVTELSPDIPPWSPLAGRDRAHGGAEAPAEPVDSGPGAAPDRPGHRRRTGWYVAFVVCVAIAIAIAIALVVGTGDRTEQPPPPTSVRRPLPSTSWREPAALGTMVALGNGWAISVTDTNLDATSELQPFNTERPLGEGQAFVLLDVTMYYLDGVDDAESPFYGVDLAVVGDDGQVVTPTDAPCTAPAPALDLTTDVARGSSATGRICFAVDAGQADTLRLTARPSMAYGARTSYLATSPTPAATEQGGG